MNLSYGLAKIGIATITNASTQFADSTDLGIQTNFQQNTVLIPAKGSIATLKTTAPTSAGSGYSLPLNGTVLCGVSGGTGTGAQVAVRTIPSGLIIAGSSVNVTAGFANFQNNLQLAFDPEATDPYTWASTTSTGAAMPDKVTGPVTTTAITSTGGSGSGATFLVSVNNGSVSKVTVSAVGSGYKIGDIITLTVANLQIPMNVANDNGSAVAQPTRIQGDIKLFLTEENITGQVTYIENILIGGSGYSVDDILTLQEVGSSQIGTATITVGALDLGQSLNSSPNNIYPRAIMISTAGATAAAPAEVTVKDLAGNSVTMEGLVTGVIRPFEFTQVTLAGGEPAIGDITIYY